MVDNFEIKCEKCSNVAIDIRGTAVQFGTAVRVKFVCLPCKFLLLRLVLKTFMIYRIMKIFLNFEYNGEVKNRTI